MINSMTTERADSQLALLLCGKVYLIMFNAWICLLAESAYTR